MRAFPNGAPAGYIAVPGTGLVVDPAHASAYATEQIILSDGRGEFALARDGTVKVLSGYPNVGTIFPAGTALNATVLANLAAVGSNRNRIKDFTGIVPAAVASAVPTAEVIVQQEAAVAPMTSRVWFWPVVGAVSVVAGGIAIWQVRKYMANRPSARKFATAVG
jgi:hypothetical protein